MSSVARTAIRAGAPPSLAVAGFLAALGPPGLRPLATAVSAAALLFCPGWGLTRLLSVIDRRFGVAGASLLLSLLVAALVALPWAGRAPELGLRLHALSVGLSVAGALRLAWHHRWQARQPPHPAPMPLWPHRAATCLLVLLAALVLLQWAAPAGAPPAGTRRLAVAATAEALLRGESDPLLAGATRGEAPLLAAAAASLSAGSGLAAPYTVALVLAAALAATLLFAAEAISRLRGNRGGTRAMLAVLLAVNPLGGLFLLGALRGGASPVERLTPGFDPHLASALQPWIDGEPDALALAFLAMLLSTTLSVVRRASFHVPRLAGLAAFGLALARPAEALTLLPAWLLGLGLAHLLSAGSLDNDPGPDNPSRRAGEPLRLRAPFWMLAVPIAAGVAGGVLLAGSPTLELGRSRAAGFGLLAAVFPACLLFVPGIRQLHRSPGREAWFFLGLLAPAVLLGLLVRRAGDEGAELARFVALLLSVPTANGALTLVERHGRRARVLLTALVVFLLPAPLALVVERAARAAPLRLPSLLDGTDSADAALPAELGEALRLVRARAPQDAVLVPPASDAHGNPVADPSLVALVAGRTLAAPGAGGLRGSPAEAREAARRSALLARLPSGEDATLLALRGAASLSGREIWTVFRTDSPPATWPGFEPVGTVGAWTVARSRPPAVVLLTVPGLAEEDLEATRFPGLVPLLEPGTRLLSAVSPAPRVPAALASLLTGLAPAEHGVLQPKDRYEGRMLTLAQAFARRGARTLALVALADDAGLLAGFDRAERLPAAEAGALVDVALARLAEPDPRPAFLWLHLADLEATADAATARAAEARVDAALSRLLTSLSPTDLVVLVSPVGPRGSATGTDLAERTVHVPLRLRGGGFPHERREGLFALQDLPALLLAGRWPERTLVPLMVPALGSEPMQWGARFEDHVTWLRPASQAGAPAGGTSFWPGPPPRAEPAERAVLRAIEGRRALALDALRKR